MPSPDARADNAPSPRVLLQTTVLGRHLPFLPEREILLGELASTSNPIELGNIIGGELLHTPTGDVRVALDNAGLDETGEWYSGGRRYRHVVDDKVTTVAVVQFEPSGKQHLVYARNERKDRDKTEQWLDRTRRLIRQRLILKTN